MSKAISKPSNILVAVCGLVLLGAIAFVSSSSFVPGHVEAQTSGPAPVTGHAWSETIGWIEFQHSKTNKVTIDADNYFQGYAWSDNLGWLKFDKNLAGPGGGTGARVVDNKVIGWARFCAGQAVSPTTDPNNTCTGGSRSDGWDGWVKFDHGRADAVTYNPATKKFAGFAWGSDVVGWVDMKLVGADLEEEIVVDPCDDTNPSNDPAGGCEGDPCTAGVNCTCQERDDCPDPTKYKLTITEITGNGTIKGPGINCSRSGEGSLLGDCEENYNEDTTVNLTREAGAGFVFERWTGACSTTGACSIIMTGTKTVGANFEEIVVSPDIIDFTLSPASTIANCDVLDCSTEFYSRVITITNISTFPISITANMANPSALNVIPEFSANSQAIQPGSSVEFRWKFNSRVKSNPAVDSYNFTVTGSASGKNPISKSAILRYIDRTQRPL